MADQIKTHWPKFLLLGIIFYIGWSIGGMYFLALPPWVLYLVIIGIFAIKSVAIFIPALPLYVGAGMLFPPAQAFSVVFLGLLANMSIGYFLGRYYGEGNVLPKLEKNKKIHKFIQKSRYNNAVLCFLMRLLFMPLDLTHMLFGALGLKYSRFVLFTYLGLAPRMVPLVLLGETTTGKFFLFYGIGLVVSVGLFAAIQRYGEKMGV